MTQKPDWSKLLASKSWIATSTHWKMTPEERQARIDEQRKKENEAVIKHKQLTAIYIDKIDDAFRDAKFKDLADVAAFHFKNRPNAGVICGHFFDFYNAHGFHDDALLVWRFLDRYFQERIELKEQYVRRL